MVLPDISDDSESNRIFLLMNVLTQKLELDYFQNLRLDQLSSTQSMQANLLSQMGLVKNSNTGFGQEILITNKAIKLSLYKYYLKALAIYKTQYQMIHFFRVGEYESREAFRFLGEFRKSKLNLVELKPEAYIIMMRALLSHDNLGYITVKEIKLDS